MNKKEFIENVRHYRQCFSLDDKHRVMSDLIGFIDSDMGIHEAINLMKLYIPELFDFSSGVYVAWSTIHDEGTLTYECMKTYVKQIVDNEMPATHNKPHKVVVDTMREMGDLLGHISTSNCDYEDFANHVTFELAHSLHGIYNYPSRGADKEFNPIYVATVDYIIDSLRNRFNEFHENGDHHDTTEVLSEILWHCLSHYHVTQSDTDCFFNDILDLYVDCYQTWAINSPQDYINSVASMLIMSPSNGVPNKRTKRHINKCIDKEVEAVADLFNIREGSDHEFFMDVVMSKLMQDNANVGDCEFVHDLQLSCDMSAHWMRRNPVDSSYLSEAVSLTTTYIDASIRRYVTNHVNKYGIKGTLGMDMCKALMLSCVNAPFRGDEAKFSREKDIDFVFNKVLERIKNT